MQRLKSSSRKSKSSSPYDSPLGDEVKLLSHLQSSESVPGRPDNKVGRSFRPNHRSADEIVLEPELYRLLFPTLEANYF